jgi:Ras family protein A
VLLICYAVSDPDSLENVPEKWVPEVRHFCPGVPFVLVGCKSDLRADPGVIADLQKKGVCVAVRFVCVCVSVCVRLSVC